MTQGNSSLVASSSYGAQQGSGNEELLADAAHRLSGLGRGAAAIAGSADDLGVLTEKASKVLGYKPPYEWRTGLERAIADVAPKVLNRDKA